MMNSVKDFRGKIEPPVEKGVLKIERYAQRLTQGYSAYGGSYLWAPGKVYSLCKMADFQNRLISRIFGVFSSGFFHRITLRCL